LSSPSVEDDQKRATLPRGEDRPRVERVEERGGPPGADSADPLLERGPIARGRDAPTNLLVERDERGLVAGAQAGDEDTRAGLELGQLLAGHAAARVEDEKDRQGERLHGDELGPLAHAVVAHLEVRLGESDDGAVPSVTNTST